MAKNSIAILGAGEAGTGAALLANKLGFDVFVSDSGTISKTNREALMQKNILFEEGRHTSQIILSYGEILKSPGIPSENHIVRLANQKGIPIISDIEFAYRFSKARIIGVTGTNGKSTFSYTLQHILQSAGFKTKIVGNVGISFCRHLLEENLDIYIVECSSYQLEDIITFKPEIAVIINIGNDHLDRYELDVMKYAMVKFKLIKNMSSDNLFVYYDDNAIVSKCVAISTPPKCIGINDYLIEEDFVMIPVYTDSRVERTIRIKKSDFNFSGKHQFLNFLFANAVAQELHIPAAQIISSIENFKGVPHRMEHFATKDGIKYFNDSKALNLEAVELALQSFGPSKNVIWIAGGLDKGNDFTKLSDTVKNKVKALICIGKNSNYILNIFYSIVNSLEFAISMEAAAALAIGYADYGDVVLFSPGSLANDMYQNFEERGEAFKNACISQM